MSTARVTDRWTNTTITVNLSDKSFRRVTRSGIDDGYLSSLTSYHSITPPITFHEFVASLTKSFINWKRFIQKTFPMTSPFDSQREQILEEGFEEVTGQGVRAFTVESLAARLGVSKKTIYKFFPTKEVLLDKILEFAKRRIVHEIERIREEESNPANRFLKMMDFIIKMTGKVSPQRMSELKVRYPLIWMKLEEFRLERRADFHEFLSDAQEAGYVRADVDIDAVATLYIHIVNSTFQPEFFIQSDMSVSETIQLFVDIITQGLFTEKGLKSVETE